MPMIHGKLAFGVKIHIKSPITPGKEAMNMALRVVEGKVTEALSFALKTVQLLPGFTFTISEAATQVVVEKVDV